VAEDSGVTFSTFVISLATSAAVHFGDVRDRESGEKRPPDLRAAAQIIDVLVMIEAKTRGNLAIEERQLLDQVLYELRMRFVEVKKATSPIVTP
jgi:hypothetical protein